MANLGGTFDPNAHEPEVALDPLPRGWYAMQIVASEVKRTQDNANSYLALEFEILEQNHPPHKGRKVFHNLNLWHTKPETVRISQGQLTSMCRAVGLGPIDDSSLLHHKPMAVRLGVQAASGDWEARNKATGWDSIASGRVGSGAPPAAPMTAPAPAAAPPMAPPSATVPAPPTPGGTTANAPAAVPPPAAQPQGQPGQAGQPPWKTGG